MPTNRGTKNNIDAIIVGAADGLDLTLFKPGDNIYALNAAYFHLVERKIHPKALITGDRRFITRIGPESMGTVIRLITFSHADRTLNGSDISALPNLELYNCLGRDGFSKNAGAGFYHGCSSFFLAVQFLVSEGYKTIRTIGVNFPPPETYNRLNGVTGHPEFVYNIQLRNLALLKKFLNDTNTEILTSDTHSNLNIFL